jgi:prolyl-tRNA editing enzyme YbaK/EbsC (Cys-tRNA(Pro) deacylase)
MKKNDIPMTTAIRALKAANVAFELKTYDFTPHGGTADAARQL